MGNTSFRVDEGFCVENWNLKIPQFSGRMKETFFILFTKPHCLSVVVVLKAKVSNNLAKLSHLQRHCR